MAYIRCGSNNGGATLIGTYTANASIDVSQYNASSADEFLLVPQSLSEQKVTQYYQNTEQGYQEMRLTYTAPSATLSDGTLSLTVGSCYFRGTSNGGGTTYGSGSLSNQVKVYFVGTIN